MNKDLNEIMEYLDCKNSIVWTNGCFDVLHGGHIKMLEYCKFLADQCGGYVFVGLDSDERIKNRKGKDRPVNSVEDRSYHLSALKYVDFVLPYDTDEELSFLVKSVQPKLMVVGDDYENKHVIGSEHGVEVAFFPKVGGHSSTEIIEKIKRGVD